MAVMRRRRSAASVVALMGMESVLIVSARALFWYPSSWESQPRRPPHGVNQVGWPRRHSTATRSECPCPEP